MAQLFDAISYFLLGDLTRNVFEFIERGGNVLWLIALLSLVMWGLALERLWYYRRQLNKDIELVHEAWFGREERHSWHAHQIRRGLISEIGQRIDRSLPMIASLVALCPLIGLLGTVTGMIEVFHVMAVTGGGDAKAMAGGVSKATIPTMAGMVAALSGVLANTVISRIAMHKKNYIEDHLILE